MPGSSPTIGTRTLARHCTRAAVAAWFLLACLIPSELRSQVGCISLLQEAIDPSCGAESPREPTRLPGHILTFGANIALGGFTAGIIQAWKGESFWKGFARGAAGGSVVYSGKWTSTQDFFGSGFVGREVAAVGASMVANASDGRALLGRVVLPVGPVRLQVDRAAPTPLQVRVDLASVVSTAYTATLPRTRLDWHLTLSSGSPVFIHSGEQPWLGVHRAGVIVMKERDEMTSTLFHERVHVAQYDFSAIAWGEPSERWLLAQIPRGPTLHRYVALGLDNALWGGVRYLLPYDNQPWEWEARFFTGK